ncbi:GNAT family N-acetyltransferase [Polaromonas sp. CG_9.11]|uniref:GNAT family N-acetyltransferase n=1 Tax=Polaromonas sp. CG_9.11 TaxID=2787730 RepID=UPI0018CBE2D4|nr:GNAT family N-acetyltransferase [Polaromonas sp. CG_9.11]MBG6076751.1 GNAT superfamily N-acetyltransferase [Polaromonas sp. CG_9.11]
MPIRSLLMADAPVYRAFRLRGLREHPDAFTSGFDEESLRPLRDSERRLAGAGSDRLWGAFVDGDMAGMVGLSRETRAHNRHKAALVGLYVADEFTGRGLGRALVDTVVQNARAWGIEHLVLTVTEGNRPAGRLYESAGFASFGTEPDAIRVNGVSFGKQHMFLQLSPS